MHRAQPPPGCLQWDHSPAYHRGALLVVSGGHIKGSTRCPEGTAALMEVRYVSGSTRGWNQRTIHVLSMSELRELPAQLTTACTSHPHSCWTGPCSGPLHRWPAASQAAHMWGQGDSGVTSRQQGHYQEHRLTLWTRCTQEALTNWRHLAGLAGDKLWGIKTPGY